MVPPSAPSPPPSTVDPDSRLAVPFLHPSPILVNHDETETEYKGASLTSATANLIVGAAGAGLLSFPYAVDQQGIIITLLTTCWFAMINAYTLTVLATFAEKKWESLHINSFEELVNLTLGSRWYYASLACILISAIGSMAGFLIIIVDVLQPVIEYVCYNDVHELHSGCHVFLTSRTFLVLSFAIVITLPLCLYRNIAKLGHSSVFAIVTVLAVVVVVMWRAIQALHSGNYPIHTDATSSISGSRDEIRLVRWEMNIFLGVPITIFSLGNHGQLIPIYTSITSSIIRTTTFRTHAIPLSTSVCAIMYLITGVFGYINFGSSTNGNVLKNFEITDWPANVAKLLMALHIALAYPIVMFPARKSFDFIRQTWNKQFYIYEEDGEMIQSQHREMIQHSNSHQQPHLSSCTSSIGPLSLSTESQRTNIIQTCIVVGITCLFAIVIPQVQIVFGVLGATVSVGQIHIFPGLMLMSDPRFYRRGVALVIFGIIIGMLCTGVTLYQQIHG